jgi:aminopeptidase N
VRTRLITFGALLSLTLTGCGDRPATPSAPPQRPVQGAASIGDPYVPGDGNGGYDVRHYDLDLHITPHAKPELSGTATIQAVADRPLSRFDLDLSGLSISAITVGGVPATYVRSGSELAVTPARPIAPGPFTATVAYSGTPREIHDPILGDYGWSRTRDGVFTGNEPSGAHTWFPSNDHPSDKATFWFRVTVPHGLTAIANGEQTGTTRSGGETTFTWREDAPMATYLAMTDVGRFNVRSGRTPGGLPIYVAVDPRVSATDVGTLYARTSQVTDAWAKTFGPYPFGSTGGVVDDVGVHFALETQTRPEYAAGMAALPSVVAHELAHQWFGDSVTPTRWSDMWLNEGFATYAEWMWGAREPGGTPVQREFDRRYARTGDAELWNVPPAAPGRGRLFSRSVYERGAMTLQALRTKVGDAKFFEVLRTWTAEHRHANATTAQFVALASRLTGRPLDAFFRVWLYEKGRPAHW